MISMEQLYAEIIVGLLDGICNSQERREACTTVALMESFLTILCSKYVWQYDIRRHLLFLVLLLTIVCERRD